MHAESCRASDAKPHLATLLAALSTAALTSGVDAQVTVRIQDYDPLTQDDLRAGVYRGQEFTLGPDTTFLLDGHNAILGPVGFYQYPGYPSYETPFDFKGSMIDVRLGYLGGPIWGPEPKSSIQNAIITMSGGRNARGTRIRDSTLDISDEAEIDDLYALNTRINVTGGRSDYTGLSINSASVFNFSTARWYGGNINVYGESVVNQVGGLISTQNAYDGTEINISGGTTNSLYAEGAVLNVSGGAVESIRALSATVLNFFGNAKASSIDLGNDTVANVTGGTFTSVHPTEYSARVNITGTDFTRNGVPVTGGSYRPQSGDIMTATVDGETPFVFTVGYPTGQTIRGLLYLNEDRRVPPPDTDRIFMTQGIAPKGLRPGQWLTLSQDASLPGSFVAVGALLELLDDTGGGEIQLAASTLNILRGDIESAITAYAGSVVNNADAYLPDVSMHQNAVLNMTGGFIGPSITLYDESSLNLKDGFVFESPVMWDSSKLHISGGLIDGDVILYGGTLNFGGGRIVGKVRSRYDSVVRIEGAGEISVDARDNAEIKLLVSAGSINGAAIQLDPDSRLAPQIAPGSAIEVVFPDGSSQTYTYDCPPATGRFCLQDDSVLTFDLELGTADYNNNGVISVGDILDYLVAYIAENPSTDMNSDGVVSTADILDFLVIWSR